MSKAEKQKEYDVVIVGAGIAGALVADRLTRSGLEVLILEAGPRLKDRQHHINRFYRAAAKVPGSPWPPDEKADAPSVLDMLGPWQDGEKNYLHQRGPLPFASTWERVVGGTVNHWQGISLRHVPKDFRVKSEYGAPGSQDWPIDYDELEPWYSEAEHLIGVSGDHEAWDGVLEAHRSRPYPMPAIPHSYQDHVLKKRLKGVLIEGEELHVLPVPQARNSVGRDGRPPCMGNTTCIPICPIQAKYDSALTLQRALARPGRRLTLRPKSVAHKIEVNSKGKVTGICYKDWEKGEEHVARGRNYVLAANTIETAKLLLMSPWKTEGKREVTVGNQSDQVGRNLMDHVIHLGWGLVDEPVYSFRGPISTGTIETFRDGAHRKEHSAFVLAVSNTGWGWADGAPHKTVHDIVKSGALGEDLRQRVADHLSRQISITAEMEQMPSPLNRVLLSKHKDKLGIRKPEIHYHLAPYEQAAFVAAKRVLGQIFVALGAEHTSVPSEGSTVFCAYGDRFQLRGAGHVMGTTRMGACAESSVVNADLQCHDHDNLFIVGGSVFPTVGTANPTLTIAALALRAAAKIAEESGKT